MRYRLHISIFFTCALLISCQQESESGFIASATLEADVWKVSPVVSGTYQAIRFREGDSLDSAQEIALIDTIPLTLKLAEIDAAFAELRANVKARTSETSTLQATNDGILREYDRATKLVADGALPPQRKDDLETQKNTSLSRLNAQQSAIQALQSKQALLTAQRNTLLDQIRRCHLLSPTRGRILNRYRNVGEAALPGRTLMEIGRSDSLWADFFISQTELANFTLGQTLRIRIDQKEAPIWANAKLIWISSDAEFTPKGVQTREARNELVFRARVISANPHGQLKRGMPVEVWMK